MTLSRSAPRALVLLATLLALAACAVGPNYKQPDLSDITPAKWKWQPARPRDEVPRGEWWAIFHDSELNRLEQTALGANQQLRVAAARMEQARILARAHSAEFVPDIRFKPEASAERNSANAPTPIPIRIPSAELSRYYLPLDLSYEIDLWGRVRRTVESARAEAAAGVADFENVRLALTAEVAANYFLLRAFDGEIDVLDRTIDLRSKVSDLIQQRFAAGNLPEVDAARVRTEVATARADLADAKRQRAEVADALALLCGHPASTFTLRPRPIGNASPPTIPAGVPADVLERRPDVAAAERLVKARNADIGIEVAGYFPTLRLTGNGGYLSKDVDSLFSGDSRAWSFGPSFSLPVTGYVLNAHKVRRAKVAREEAISTYRQAVLTAIKEVETSMSDIRYRGDQLSAIESAAADASHATRLTKMTYDAGAVSFIELLEAERTRLLLERQSVHLRAQRMIATVRLIKALGGGWK